MFSLNETYQELLLEQEAKVMLIRQAIQNKWHVSIRYMRPDGSIGTWREIEPVGFGYTKAGNLCVRAWFNKGESQTPLNTPNWRLYRIDRIAQVKTSKTPFTKPRPKFNKNGDRTMRQVLMLAKF